MTESTPPVRFRRLGEIEPSAKALSKAFSGIAPLERPPPDLIQRVRSNVERKHSLGRRGRWNPRLLGGLVVVGTLAALTMHRRPSASSEAVKPAAAPIAANRPADSPPPPSKQVAPVVAPVPPAESTEVRRPEASASRLPVRRSSPGTPSNPRAEARPPSGADLEATMLGRALHALQDEHDATHALAALHDYFSAFPAGQLRSEARFTEVEALMVAGRTDEALNRLQPEAIVAMPRAAELFVLRGELLARRGRCVEALVAFGQGSARAPTDASLLQRVLAGRKFCQSEERGPTDAHP